MFININLETEEAQKLDAVRPGTVIRCQDGILWITQDGDRDDHILKAGDTFTVTRKGNIVLQALNSSSSFSLN